MIDEKSKIFMNITNFEKHEKVRAMPNRSASHFAFLHKFGFNFNLFSNHFYQDSSS